MLFSIKKGLTSSQVLDAYQSLAINFGKHVIFLVIPLPQYHTPYHVLSALSSHS